MMQRACYVKSCRGLACKAVCIQGANIQDQSMRERAQSEHVVFIDPAACVAAISVANQMWWLLCNGSKHTRFYGNQLLLETH